MTARNNLEHHGTLAANPFAEILVEISQGRLDGSLRLNDRDRKAIIYFRNGRVVYAVSNAKSLRLFNILLRNDSIDTKTVARHPNFANDIEFANGLIAGGVLKKEAIDDAFNTQMNDIVVDVLTWPEGDWTFNSLVRARAELDYSIDTQAILIDYARCASAERIYTRFKSVVENFCVAPDSSPPADLQAHEAFMLAQFGDQSYTIDQLRQTSSLPEGGVLQALYVLWLGGLLVRKNWNSGFSAARIDELINAKVSKIKSAEGGLSDSAPEEIAPKPEEAAPEPEKPKLPEVTITLEKYLEQIEGAQTHYDALNVGTNADSAAIKNAYFSLAKQFHPDRFHRESDAMLKRIQSAFTVLSHAHETLKTPEAREVYNSKMYKEIEAREKRKAAGQPDITDPNQRQAEQGLESFEEGLNYLNDEEYEAAAAYLARAVHYSPQNALFQAYYGTALSKTEDKQRHKAEGALQTAVKLDPKNVKIRMMLVDFFLENKMIKRAEGELNRFLELVPGNKEAEAALAKLKPKAETQP